jgi:hypothetical protein
MGSTTRSIPGLAANALYRVCRVTATGTQPADRAFIAAHPTTTYMVILHARLQHGCTREAH